MTVLACPHGERCGGCTRLGVDYADQLVEKRARLVDALAPFAELRGVEVAAPRAAIAEEYRTRAKLVVGPGGALGLYAKGGGHDVVDVPECRVLAPAVKAGADAARAVLREAGARARGVSAVDVRECLSPGGEARLSVTFVGDGSADVDALAEALVRREPRVASVAFSERAPGSPRVLGSGHRVVHGAAALPDMIGASLYELAAPGAFVQAHRGTAVALRSAVTAGLRGALGDLRDARVLDLFAGSGAFGLVLARDGADVRAVESYPPAVARATEAARAQGIETFRAEVGDAAQVVGVLAEADTRVDAVVVDPPRRGLPPPLRVALAALAPKVVAYVSCEPRTLARDLAHLARLGLAPHHATPFDMLPQTADVETLALLVPSPPPPPRVLFEDARLVVVDKDPHEPTTPQGEHARSTLDRVRGLPGCAGAVPVHRLDAGTSGVCLFAKHESHVAALARALGDGEKEYLALVRGIPRDKGSITRPLKDEGRAQPARTRYKRLAIVGGHGLVVARPDQGRLHQVRRHLASIGHAVLGDARHGHAASNRHLEERFGLDRTFLHCAKIALAGGPVLEAPLAPDLEAVKKAMEA